MAYYVYALRAGAEGLPYWVGVTNNVERAERDVLAGSGPDVLKRWVGSLRPEKPRLEVLHTVNDKVEALRLELEEVSELRRRGMPLLNVLTPQQKMKYEKTQVRKTEQQRQAARPALDPYLAKLLGKTKPRKGGA